VPQTQRNSLPYPSLTTPAAPDVPADLAALATPLDSLVVSRYATSADRTARVPAPVVGELCHLGSERRVDLYDNGAWREAFSVTPWTPYTPAWTTPTSGATITVGNAGLGGRFKRFGTVCFFDLWLTIGSTTTISGTAVFHLSLPLAARVFDPAVQEDPLFAGTAVDASAGARYPLYAALISASVIVGLTYASPSTALASNNPFATNAGDRYRFGGVYEVAP